jgi:sugar phosphate isomerase/epimerase
MKLKLACADFTFPLLSHDHVLDLIAMLEIPGVDIGLFDGRSHIRPAAIKDVGGAARQLSKRLRDRGLELADVFLIPGSFTTGAPNHPDPNERRKSRDLFQRMLLFAARCKARHMTGLPGVFWEEESGDDSLKRCSEELAWRVEQAKEEGIVFSIEAHIGSIVPTPQDVARLIRMTPSLTLTLDYTHFTYLGIDDGEIEPLLPYASHFHARCATQARPQVRFRDNSIDYARVLRTMKRTNYGGYVGLEYVWIDWEHCDEVDNLSETIQLRDLLRSESAKL